MNPEIWSDKERDRRADERFMREALRQARKAYALGESPIGCVIVRGDRIIARGYNRRTTDHNTLAHAEVIAIRRACKKEGDWRLEGCRMYVTLEPCPMCAGALLQCRMDEVIIGCMSPKSGCAGSVMNLGGRRLQPQGASDPGRSGGGMLCADEGFLSGAAGKSEGRKAGAKGAGERGSVRRAPLS